MSSNYLFLKIKKKGRFFDIESNDNYLSMLFDIFDDGSWLEEGVKRELLNPSSRGITGNKTSIYIEGEKIIISPLFSPNPDEYAITIDRTKLLNLIDRWQEIMKLNPDEILFKRIGTCIKIEPIFYEKLNK
ncbi:MAG: hypothetical protein OHK0036_20490 [Bacteroidia bacterium]